MKQLYEQAAAYVCTWETVDGLTFRCRLCFCMHCVRVLIWVQSAVSAVLVLCHRCALVRVAVVSLILAQTNAGQSNAVGREDSLMFLHRGILCTQKQLRCCVV